MSLSCIGREMEACVLHVGTEVWVSVFFKELIASHQMGVY